MARSQRITSKIPFIQVWDSKNPIPEVIFPCSKLRFSISQESVSTHLNDSLNDSSEPALSHSSKVQSDDASSKSRGNPQQMPTESFHFSKALTSLTNDISHHCPALYHLRAEQILFGFTRSRNRCLEGLQGRIEGLRFKDGRLRESKNNKLYQVQRWRLNGKEILYLIVLPFPRFLQQTYQERLQTIFHELYHISPAFDGDLRRFSGRYIYHTANEQAFERKVGKIIDDYLIHQTNFKFSEFLYWTPSQWRFRYKQIYFYALANPRIIALDAVSKSDLSKNGRSKNAN